MIGKPAEQTGGMMESVEPKLLRIITDWVVV